jgi:hypothetical protein
MESGGEQSFLVIHMKPETQLVTLLLPFSDHRTAHDVSTGAVVG